MKRIFAVVNPVAGDGSADAVCAAIEKHFTPDQWQVRVELSEGEADLQRLVKTAVSDNQYDWVLVAGGDGTVSLAADCLRDSDLPLAFIPVGTANGLAMAFGLESEPDAACAQLTGKTAVRPIDAILINEQLFLLHAGVGIHSDAIENTSREEKQKLGFLAYLRRFLQYLWRSKTYRFWVVVDDWQGHVQASQVMLVNSGSLGVPAFHFGRQIKPDDQKVDVLIFEADTVRDYLQYFWRSLLGKEKQDSRVLFLQAKERVQVEGPESLPINGDGEMIGEMPLRAKILPHAVNLVVPE